MENKLCEDIYRRYVQNFPDRDERRVVGTDSQVVIRFAIRVLSRS